MRSGPLAAGAALWRRAAIPGASLNTFAARDGQSGERDAEVYTGPARQGPVDQTRMEPSGPNAVTVFDARYAGGRSPQDAMSAVGHPIWPQARAAARTNGATGGPRLSLPLIAAISVALVVLVVMAITVGSLLGDPNLLNGQPGIGLGPHPTATTRPTPTATPLPTPSPTPLLPANWLSINPDSVQMGCKSSKLKAYVRLTNDGPTSLDWYERAESLLPGVSAYPASGSLEAGHTVTITLTNTDVIFNHDGALDFIPKDPDAGAPAVISYSVTCY